MPQALVSLGANLGDRRSALDRAAAALGALPACRLVARSPWYETAPVGGPLGQDVFLNGVVRLETSLLPSELLAELLAVEAAAGRERSVDWGPRTLDLDLLFYDDRVLDSPELVVPHPRVAFRKFVLQGAVAVAPDWRHPLLGRTLSKLLAHLETAPRYVAMVGATPGFRSQLASEAAHVAGVRLVESTEPSLPATVDEVVCDGPDLSRPIEFVRGRAEALRRSLAAGDDWFVDDAWFEDEVSELHRRIPVARRAEFAVACSEERPTLPPPRLLANVVRTGESRHQAALALRATDLGAAELPPVVDLVVADRERALAELAAAMEAAG